MNDSTAVADSGVVDEDVGVAEVGLYRGEQVGDGRLVGNVGRNGEELDVGVDSLQTGLDGGKLRGVGGHQYNGFGTSFGKRWSNSLSAFINMSAIHRAQLARG